LAPGSLGLDQNAQQFLFKPFDALVDSLNQKCWPNWQEFQKSKQASTIVPWSQWESWHVETLLTDVPIDS